MTDPILDVYDDHSGSVLTRLVPEKGSLPEEVKTASVVTGDDVDEVFALILRAEDGTKKRKYACVDAGNTVLSVLYFMDRKNILPDEMRKVAAHNLVVACYRHGITVPPVLEKQAGEEGGVQYFEERYIDARQSPEIKHSTHNGLPLDTFEEVKRASVEFYENHRRIHPRDRREMAISIDKRANALGIETSPEMKRYAGDSYSRDLASGIDIRTGLLEGRDERELYNELYKRASSTSPEVFAEALAGLDAQTGLSEYWDSYVPDPFFTTFDKVAEAEFEHTDGVDKVTGTDLHRLAKDGRKLLERHFGQDLVDGFTKDPVSIFKSLPVPHKKIVMRLAQDNNFPGGEAT